MITPLMVASLAPGHIAGIAATPNSCSSAGIRLGLGHCSNYLKLTSFENHEPFVESVLYDRIGSLPLSIKSAQPISAGMR